MHFLSILLITILVCTWQCREGSGALLQDPYFKNDTALIEASSYITSLIRQFENDKHNIGVEELERLLTALHAKADERRHDIPCIRDPAKTNQTDEAMCLNASSLLSAFDLDDDHHLTETEFLRACPAILHGFFQSSSKPQPTPLESLPLYGYSTLAVALISLCSLGGVVLLPMLQFTAYKHILTGFIALGMGTLLGDALLHLIPEALNLYDHEDGSSNDYLWKSVVIMFSLYGLVVFETMMDIGHHTGQTSHQCPRRHSHSHIPSPEDLVRSQPPQRKLSFQEKPETPNSTEVESNAAEVGPDKPTNVTVILPPEVSPSEEKRHFLRQCYRVKALALVVILGDTIHNIGDGLAVGAAFSSSLNSGISTSIAIFCHELPHEFGDFVILVSTGMSYQKALLVNFLCALTAFVGLYAGISLASEQGFRRWIFAFTAGMFIYIAVGDMLPELRNHNKNLGVFFVQNVGMLMGMFLMILVSFFEHRLHF